MRRANNTSLVIVILGSLVVCLSGLTAGGQAREKVIEKARTENEVVQFSEIKVSQKVVEPGKAFDDDDEEWAGKIFLKVKNISDKAIVYLSVNINFPETRATGAMMSYPIVLGQMPGSKFRQFHDPISLLPGDSLEIPVTQNRERMKSFVEQGMPFRDITKVELEIGFVVFADKTAWSAGSLKRQNPNNPDRYDPIPSATPQ